LAPVTKHITKRTSAVKPLFRSNQLQNLDSVPPRVQEIKNLHLPDIHLMCSAADRIAHHLDECLEIRTSAERNIVLRIESLDDVVDALLEVSRSHVYPLVRTLAVKPI